MVLLFQREDYCQFDCFFGYSLAPNMVDPILTLVLPSSTCTNHQVYPLGFHSLLQLYFDELQLKYIITSMIRLMKQKVFNICHFEKLSFVVQWGKIYYHHPVLFSRQQRNLPPSWEISQYSQLKNSLTASSKSPDIPIDSSHCSSAIPSASQTSLLQLANV